MRDDQEAGLEVRRGRERDLPKLADVVRLDAAESLDGENPGLRVLAKLIARDIESSNLTSGRDGASVAAKEA